jgi:hypothetical protein
MLEVVVAILEIKSKDQICTSRPKYLSTGLTSHVGRFDLIEASLHRDGIYWCIQTSLWGRASVVVTGYLIVRGFQQGHGSIFCGVWTLVLGATFTRHSTVPELI